MNLLALKFITPVQLPFGLDGSGFVRGASVSGYDTTEKTHGQFLEALRRVRPDLIWAGPSGMVYSEQTMLGHEAGRAPSQRPIFILEFVDPSPQTDLEAFAAAIGLPLKIRTVRCAIQDFGIATFDFEFEGADCDANDIAYINRVNQVCERLSSVCIPAYWDVLSDIRAQAREMGLEQIPFYYRGGSDEAVEPRGIPNAPQVFWVHSLSIFDQSILSDDKLENWRNGYMNHGVPPRVGHAIDTISRLRGARYVPLHVREYDFDLVVGWGHSFAMAKAVEGDKPLEASVPMDLVFNLSQAYSALLYRINKTSLQMSTAFLENKKAIDAKKAFRISEASEELSEQLSASLALQREQRFCMSAVEQKVWDACFSEWGGDRLVEDVVAQVDRLKVMTDAHERKLNEQRTRRLTLAAFFVTMYSAAAIVFAMIPNIILSETPSYLELGIQGVTVAVFLIVSLVFMSSKTRS